MGASIIYRRHLAWVDTDASGHHHNSAIMRFVEAAEAQLVRSRGIPDYFGVAPRVRHEVDYESRLYFGQPTTTRLVVERIGQRSMTFAFEVWGEAHDGRPRARAARGTVVVAHVPVGSPTAQPWPRRIVAALEGDGATTT